MKDINPVIAGVLCSHFPALARQPDSNADAAERARVYAEAEARERQRDARALDLQLRHQRGAQ